MSLSYIHLLSKTFILLKFKVSRILVFFFFLIFSFYSLEKTCPSSRYEEIPEVVSSRGAIGPGEILHTVQTN